MRSMRFTVIVGLMVALSLATTLGATAALGQGANPPAGAEIVAWSPATPAHGLAAAGATIYRTTDGGATWQEAGQLPNPVRSLTLTAGQDGIALAGAAASGIYRSFDDGASWQAVNDGVGLMPGVIVEVNALGADPQDPNIIYAATGYQLGSTTVRFTPTALLVSVDAGTTWLPLATLPLNSPRFVSLTTAPGQPLTVLATAADGAEAVYSADSAALTALLAAPEASAGQRVAAARALGLLGDVSAAPALMTALQSGDLALTNAAASSLGALRVEAAVPALTSLLAQPEHASTSVVADALAAIGTPDALAPLHQALESAEMTPTRHAAMAALERLGSAAVPGLLAMTTAENAVAQRNAVEMLGWIADPAAVDGLTAALHAANADVRSQAAWALGETLAGVAQPGETELAAQQALADAAFSDLSPDVRIHATQALGRLPQLATAAAAASDGADTAPTTGYAPVSQRAGLRLPGWLTEAAPALGWLVLGLALAAIAVLPWYQNLRDHRKTRRHN